MWFPYSFHGWKSNGIFFPDICCRNLVKLLEVYLTILSGPSCAWDFQEFVTWVLRASRNAPITVQVFLSVTGCYGSFHSWALTLVLGCGQWFDLCPVTAPRGVAEFSVPILRKQYWLPSSFYKEWETKVQNLIFHFNL